MEEWQEKIKKLKIEEQAIIVIIAGEVMKMIREYETEKASTEIYNWLRHEQYTPKETIQILKLLTEKVDKAIRIIEEKKQEAKK